MPLPQYVKEELLAKQQERQHLKSEEEPSLDAPQSISLDVPISSDLNRLTSEPASQTVLTETEVISGDSTSSETQTIEPDVDIEGFVSKRYLSRLASCDVVPFMDGKMPGLRWYNVNKLVYEKGVFYVDQLSKLFSALHDISSQVAIVVQKEAKGIANLYIGARDFSGSNYTSGDTLRSCIDGYIHGTSYISDSPEFKNYNTPAIASVSAIATLKDDDMDTFIQGVDNLINAAINVPFTAYFIADSITEGERVRILSGYQDLYTKLSPFDKTQQTLTEGENSSFTKNISKSISSSVSRTITNGSSYSKSSNESVANSESYSNSESVGFLFWSSSSSQTNGITKQMSTGFVNGTQESTADGKVDGTQTQEGTAEQTGKQTSKAVTLNFENKRVTDLKKTIEDQCERLKKSAQYGLWNCAAYIVSNSDSTSKQLAGIYKGYVVGEESGNEVSAINVWERNDPRNNQILEYLNKVQHPRFDCDGQIVTAGSTVNSKELAIHLSLPQHSVPGIIVQERASFGRNVHDYNSADNSRKIHLGKIHNLGRTESADVDVDLESLSSHTLISGTTGSGKSNTLYSLLGQLRENGVKFLVIEPAKGEYKDVFGNYPDVRVLGSNRKTMELLRMNPFVVPDSMEVSNHIDKLVEIFCACWPMYAAMPQVLKASILKAYELCGWSIDDSENPYNLFPTFSDVEYCLKNYVKSSDYSADTKGDYIGALTMRLNSLQTGTAGRMLNVTEQIPDSELFNENVIVDLSEIESSETLSLIMGLLVMKLDEFRKFEKKGRNLQLRHVTVLEEAHNLLKRTSTEQNMESSNVRGMSVESISKCISQMRTYGEGFIIADQSPSMLDMSVISCTNTKVIMALPHQEDRDSACKSIGLSEEQFAEITKQKRGEAIVYQNSWEEAVQCKVDKFEVENGDYEYQSQPIAKDEISVEVFKMLLSGRMSAPIDFDIRIVEQNIRKTNKVSSDVKVMTLDAIGDISGSGQTTLWDDGRFKELSYIVSSILGIEGEIGQFFEDADFNSINSNLKRVIHKKYPKMPDALDMVLIQCQLRYLTIVDDRYLSVYKGWKDNANN